MHINMVLHKFTTASTDLGSPFNFIKHSLVNITKTTDSYVETAFFISSTSGFQESSLYEHI